MFKRTVVVALAMLMSLTLVICMAPSSDAVDQSTMPTKIIVGSEEIDIENGDEVLLTGNTDCIPLTPAVSPDGKRVAFENAQDASIYVMDLKY